MEDAARRWSAKVQRCDRENVRRRRFNDSYPDRLPGARSDGREMREAVRRAARLALRAEDELQEAGTVIANGYDRLDRGEWMRGKRRAALADR